jgi:uncharacterized membrane protein YidH (DUF202 family)
MTVYGAAPERTALAWQRSGLGVVVGCFLVFRTAIALGVIPVGVVAGLLGALVAALLLFVIPSARFLRGHTTGTWVALTTAALVVVGLGALGAVTAIILLVRRAPG